MQCLGVPSCRRGSVNRSRELYLQEQSRKVAALNGQRLGKGLQGTRRAGCGGRGQQLEQDAPPCKPQIIHV